MGILDGLIQNPNDQTYALLGALGAGLLGATTGRNPAQSIARGVGGGITGLYGGIQAAQGQQSKLLENQRLQQLIDSQGQQNQMSKDRLTLDRDKFNADERYKTYLMGKAEEEAQRKQAQTAMENANFQEGVRAYNAPRERGRMTQEGAFFTRPEVADIAERYGTPTAPVTTEPTLAERLGAIGQMYEGGEKGRTIAGQLLQDMNKPVKDDAVAPLREFEMATGTNPSMRGTPEYQKGYMNFLNSKKQSTSININAPTAGAVANMGDLVASGQVTLESIPQRGGTRAQVLDYLAKNYPGVNPVELTANAKFKQSSANQQTLVNIGAVQPLMEDLKAEYEALKQTSTMPINKFTNYVREQMGDPAIAAFNTKRNSVILEVTRALQGSGQMSDKRVQLELENLNNAYSPAQMDAALKNLQDVLNSRKSAALSVPYANQGNKGATQGGNATSSGNRFTIREVK